MPRPPESGAVSQSIRRSLSRPASRFAWSSTAAASNRRPAASIADVLGVDIRVPDHTTLSRRGGGLTILLKRIDRDEPLHLLVDRRSYVGGARPTFVGPLS